MCGTGIIGVCIPLCSYSVLSVFVIHWLIVTFVSWVLVFLFQAEDGIRDLVRSRGLGDVYKRQPGAGGAGMRAVLEGIPRLTADPGDRPGPGPGADPVSYTHLTLPTSDLV